MNNKANLRALIAATGLLILLKFDPNHRFFVPCDLEIWWMTLENNRAPLLYYIKLCLSIQIRWWIETEVTVRKRSIRVKISDFVSSVTLKFDGSPWKTIGHLFCVASSFVHHFTAISQFKLELQSGNAQFLVKIDFFSRLTLKFNGWPSKTIGHLFYATSSFVHHFILIGEFKFELQSGNTQFGSKSTIFLAVWPWNFTDDLQKTKKTIGHLFYATSSSVYRFVPIGEFKLELQSGNAQFGSNSTIFRALRPSNLTDDLEKQYSTSSMLLQALCSISYPLVNSNWSYSPETPNLGQIRRV